MNLIKTINLLKPISERYKNLVITQLSQLDTIGCSDQSIIIFGSLGLTTQEVLSLCLAR